MVKVADSAAVVVGEKTTLSWQLAPAASVSPGAKGHAVVPVVLDTVKSEGFAPEVGKLLIVRAVFAPLVSVIVWGGLVVLTVWLPKAIVVGATKTVPAVEAGENLTTKASSIPPKILWKAFEDVVNATVESVPPAI